MNIYGMLADLDRWGIVFFICVVAIYWIYKGLEKVMKQRDEGKKAEETQRRERTESRRRERTNAEETRRREQTRADAHQKVQELMSQEDMTASICYRCNGMGKIQSGQDKVWRDCPECGGIGYKYHEQIF